MANALTPLMYKILANAYLTLRNNLVMPRLVFSDFGEEMKTKGATVDVKLPSAVSTYDLVPAETASGDNLPADQGPTTVPVTLDKWRGASFYLTDKDIQEIDAKKHFLPMETAEAVASLAEYVNGQMLALYPGVYGYAGTAGQTPFQDVTVDGSPHKGVRALVDARKVLMIQKCPMNNRKCVLGPEAAGNAIALSNFQNADKRGSAETLANGMLGHVYGFDTHEVQEVRTHTAGTITTGAIAKAATAQAVGLKSVVCTTAAVSGAVALVVGDIVTFAGSTQTHTVTEAVTQGSAATDFTLKIEPGLAVALAGSEALAVKATHVVNLAFHPLSIAFANRPLEDDLIGNENIVSVPDPLTNLVMRLERKRAHKRTKWEFDILFGCKLVRPALATRLVG